MTPELRQLRYFVALAEELSFTRAAQKANLVQQGLSSAIQRLERSVGVRLVERDSHRVALTPAGEAFLVEARRTLAQADEAVEAARRAARGEGGQLRIGYVAPVGIDTLPRLVRELNRRHPELALVPREQWSSEITRALRTGELDVGLVRYAAPAGLHRERVRSEPLLAALPSTHPLAGDGPLALRDLAGETLMIRPASDGYNRAVIQACRDAGFEPPVLRTPVHGNPALAPVADGRGVALTSRSLAAIATDGVTFVELAPPVPTLPVDVLWPPNPPASVELFLEVVRDVAARASWRRPPGGEDR